MNRAYRYALLPPVEWPDAAEREIALQRHLWNRLVEIERQFQAAQHELLRRDPDFRALDDRLPAISDRLDAAYGERRTARQQARARVATPDLDATIATATEERREIWDAQKPLRRSLRAAMADEFAAAADRRYAAVTMARQQSGLWWPNYNAVIASFDAAVRALKPGASLRPWTPDDPRPDRLTVQVQKGAPAAALIAHGRPEVWIDADPADGCRKRAGSRRSQLRHMMRLHLTYHSEGPGTRRTVSWPMLMHRPFPDGAIVKSVAVSRSPTPGRFARHWEWSASFAVELPDPAAHPLNLGCGVDPGWRIVEGGLRVATIAGSDGLVEHLVLPQSWLDARAGVADEFARLKEIEDDTERREFHMGWRRRLARLNGRRKDLYARTAALLAQRYGAVAIDKTGTARIAQDRAMPPTVRRMRTWAAPDEFVLLLRHAVTKSGGRVKDISGPSTMTCHLCGHQNRVPDAWRADLVWRCEGCRKLWDQDENAARNLLAALDSSALAVGLVEAAKPAAPKRARITRRGDRSKSGRQAVAPPPQIS